MTTSSHRHDKRQPHGGKQCKGDKDKDKDNSGSDTSSTVSGLTENSFAQSTDTCWCCGKKGHRSPNCKKKDSILKDQWYFNKLETQNQALQSVNETADASDDSLIESRATTNTDANASRRSRSSRRQWSSQHFVVSASTSHQDDAGLQNHIFLDSSMSMDMACNRKYVENVRQSRDPVRIATNAGS